MPASYLMERSPTVIGLTQPLGHHPGSFHHHEASSSGGCATAPRPSTGGAVTTAPQFALQDLVNFASVNLNMSATAVTVSSAADTTIVTASLTSNPSTLSGIGSSPVLGRSAVTSSPSSASSSSSTGSLGPIVVSAVDDSLGAATITHGSSNNRKSANMTECVPVPSSEHVAEIVGRQGSKIKALRNKTNTYIKTPVRGEEPVFVVTGRREDVAAAKREILSASEHFSQIRASRLGACNGTVPVGTTGSSGRAASTVSLPSGDLPGQVTIQVRVPYRVVGLVVGPKGATIKRIQQDSATYIVTPSRDREPVFEVTGTPDGVEKARRDIASYIAQRTGSTSEPDAMYPEVSMSEPLIASKELDSHMMFGSVLKLGNSIGMNNNNNNHAALMTSYNNAVNHLGSSRIPTLDFSGHQQMVGNGLSYDNSAYANSVLKAALEKSMQPAPAMKMNGCGVNYNINNNMIGSMAETWPISNGCSDQILRNLMSSLFPPIGDHAMTGQGTNKCGMLSVAMPPYDDQLGSFGHLDALVTNCLPSQTPDYCMSNSPAILGTSMPDPIEVGFQIQQFGAFQRGGSGSAESSLSSVSPTDSTTSVHRGFGQSSSSAGSPCCLCSEAIKTSALVPCGHNLFCKDCADAIVSRPEQEDRRCPVCGETASLAIRILS